MSSDINNNNTADPDTGPAIYVENLTFTHSPGAEPALSNLNLSLPRGSRTLLIGANGAGKSTLLQLLAGKRLLPKSSIVRVLGADVFTRTSARITFLGTEWASNPVVRGDIAVSHFLDSVGGYRHAERRDRLLDLLDVDLDWHMHMISDGERRRVQLVMGLMAPWDVLLLDEVTVDLDVLVRDELLTFLKKESESRGATILYATHIFDGLNAFPTSIIHMRLGEIVGEPLPWPSPSRLIELVALPTTIDSEFTRSGSTLHMTALQWLKGDREHRRELERNGRKMRGARRAVNGSDSVPTDSETFFRKYDYNN
ncbi:P-loop containing nucleoside triphosphate hydrolase protein [Fomitiporia mediterranea MF3/22]|uniref:P-loop containing nucleoside triphosphate hydrolase protein n=1 Tax=Fomitiporia mediterranea (strain MF3/22) TaxID=694068 RepID=UPI00044089F0|nr:P-loop containing nucleoside triphosphate hydrolase protein [Fomitiporia mediterranea MF3/22]EJD00910.1 P-loop containing nucleoside triphosphate hydrolase protein [Fomitiporia mediterranea MF3/22]